MRLAYHPRARERVAVEGLESAKLASNGLHSPGARRRVRGMRRVFRAHENHTYAVSLVATKQ